jgi:hypothetical protein
MKRVTKEEKALPGCRSRTHSLRVASWNRCSQSSEGKKELVVVAVALLLVVSCVSGRQQLLELKAACSCCAPTSPSQKFCGQDRKRPRKCLKPAFLLHFRRSKQYWKRKGFSARGIVTDVPGGGRPGRGGAPPPRRASAVGLPAPVATPLATSTTPCPQL